MTKQEFEDNELPLALIASVHLETGKAMIDTYDYNVSEVWLRDIRKDFPDYIHFYTINKAAVRVRVLELTGGEL